MSFLPEQSVERPPNQS